MDISQKFAIWMQKTENHTLLHQELVDIQSDLDAISDRFWRDLEFGTGGLRGIIGAGTNRINLFTIGKATQGLANYLKKRINFPSVVIAYDTRNFSKEFAEKAAEVLCANGIKTYLFDGVRPTPMLSFAVHQLAANAGIVITASHNPREYNGYKVYGDDGGQITDEAAQAILKEIECCNIFDDVKFCDLQSTTFLEMINAVVDLPYYQNVEKLAMRKELIKENATNFRILYSPLHGSGNIPVRTALTNLGFTNLEVVPEQELPDGNFPTVPYPNPEEPAVFELAKSHAKSFCPDLIFATDPDCDRIGVLVQEEPEIYSVLSGNQVGALLCDYLIRTHIELGIMPPNPAIIKTIVTSDMGKAICQEYNVHMSETLTGFKYIGELIGLWSETKEHSFLLGFEESYGYLVGDFVRDKDAVIASVLIAEMALWYKTQGLSLYKAMDQLYKKFGYYKEKLISITMPGQEGQAKMQSILAKLREDYQNSFSGQTLMYLEDYGQLLKYYASDNTTQPLSLPKSNVLKFVFSDSCWVVFRPSGTEPKIKVYIAVKSESAIDAQQRLETLEACARNILS